MARKTITNLSNYRLLKPYKLISFIQAQFPILLNKPIQHISIFSFLTTSKFQLYVNLQITIITFASSSKLLKNISMKKVNNFYRIQSNIQNWTNAKFKHPIIPPNTIDHLYLSSQKPFNSTPPLQQYFSTVSFLTEIIHLDNHFENFVYK